MKSKFPSLVKSAKGSNIAPMQVTIVAIGTCMLTAIFRPCRGSPKTAKASFGYYALHANTNVQ